MQKGLDSKGVYRQGAGYIMCPKAYWLALYCTTQDANPY